MADFFQSKTLVTLSNICHQDHILNFKKEQGAYRLVVLIPCLYRHFEKGHLKLLLATLARIDYLSEIVVVLNGKKNSHVSIEHLKTIDHRISLLVKGDEPSLEGKGSALYFGFAYIYQKYNELAIISTIDADIKSFSASYLLKLFYPLLKCDADFNKGYYVRYSDNKLDGRLTRLLVFPLLYAMREQSSNLSILDFLLEFRYPLSGEIAIKSHLLKDLKIMPNWSYDLSLLIAMHKYPQARLFQTEITDNFSHEHRQLDLNSNDGLLIVAQDIIFYLMSLDEFNSELLVSDYQIHAKGFLDKYAHLASFNGLKINHNNEERLIKEIISIILRKPKVKTDGLLLHG